MGVLQTLIGLTNDDIFGEVLRLLDHAQAEGGGHWPGEEEMEIVAPPVAAVGVHDDVIIVVPVQQEA